MSPSIIVVLRDEEADLARKLAACRAMLTAYAGDQASDDNVVTERAMKSDGRVKTDPGGATRASSYVRDVLKASHVVISDNAGGPVPTRVMLDGVQRHGIEVRGKEPQNALSAILSRASDFQNRRGEGWVVATQQHADDVADVGLLSENEASTGQAKDASEVEGVAAPSNIENRQTLRLIG